MSVIGIGTDIVHIPRIEHILEKSEIAFCRRVLHENEWLEYQQCSQPLAFVAKRFAVKEATAKALGVGIGKSASLTDIETIHNELGKPELCLHGDAKQTAESLGVVQTHLSIADEKEYAIAYVILTGQ